MILYHASTLYHSLCCLVHKLAFHPREEAELLLVEYMFRGDEMEAFIQKLNSYGWFTRIRVVPESRLAENSRKKLTLSSSAREIENTAKKISDGVMEWLGHDLREYDEINLLAEQWSLGIAVLYQRIPNNFFEDGSGLLGDEGRYFRIVKEISMKNYVLLKYLKGGGNNSFTKVKYCDMRNQPPGFYDSKAADFNIPHLISEKIPDKVEQLLELYHGKKITTGGEKKMVLFMTQFIRTLTDHNFAVQEKMTAVLWDYFVPEETLLVVKPHPKDCYIDYRKIAPECVVLDRRLPSELLPFVFDRPVQLVLTASSTSTGGVSGITEEVMQFTPDIESHFYRLPVYYAISRMVEALYRGQDICICQKGRPYVENLLTIHGRKEILQSHGSQIRLWVDPEPGSGDVEQDIYIFSDSSRCFLYQKEFSAENWMICEVYMEEKTGRKSKCDIYLYCKDGEIRKEMKRMKEEKELLYSGNRLEMVICEASQLQIEKGKQKALLYALREKEKESQDKVLLEMNTIIDSYYKKEALLENMLADDGWRGEYIE